MQNYSKIELLETEALNAFIEKRSDVIKKEDCKWLSSY